MKLTSKRLNVIKLLPFFSVLFICLFASRYLLSSGFIPTHDAEYHIIRLWQFNKMIKSGFFIPRWAPDLNNSYGVPLFEFFYPLPNYLGEIFHLFGFSFIKSVYLVLASGLIISGITFYLWLRCFLKPWPATTGAIFYLLAPYHLVDVFIRGSVGEVWALAIVPLTLFFTTKLIQEKNKRNQKKWMVLNSITLLPLLTSHNILGVLFTVFSLFYAFILIIYYKKKMKMQISGSYIMGFFLSAFFWLPVIFESQYVKGLNIVDFKSHFPSLDQLLIPSWGTGFSGTEFLADQMSFQIGIPHSLAFFAALFLYLFKRKKNPLILFLLVVSGGTVFFTLSFSEPIWRFLPFMQYFQYPWRLLSVIILATSFLAGYFSSWKPKLAVPLLLVSALIFYLPYTKPVVYQPREDSFYLSNPDWTTGTATLGNTFNTKWFDSSQGKLDSAQKVKIIKGKAILGYLDLKPVQYKLIVKVITDLDLQINTAYFPGWQIWVDGEKIRISQKNGLIRFSIPKGDHQVIVYFGKSLVRQIAEIISLLTIGLLILIWGYEFRVIRPFPRESRFGRNGRKQRFSNR